MKRIITAIMFLVSVMMLSGCSKYYYLGCVGCCIPSEEQKSRNEDLRNWDEEQAKIIAQSYLEEKYDEEFIFVSKKARSRKYKDLVVICSFIRKDDEEVEDPMEYHVDVVYKSGEYTVKGDDYMYVYIRKVAEDFLRPYVENRFSDIEYVFFVKRAEDQCGVLNSEYFADAEIPRSFDELCDVTGGIYFQINVPESEDQNKVIEACSLLRSDLEELEMRIRIGGYLKVGGRNIDIIEPKWWIKTK